MADLLVVLDKENQTKEEHLDQGVLVDTGCLHPFSEWVGRILGWLLEEHEESLPELNLRQGAETHEQEDTIQDREWDELQYTCDSNGNTNQQVTSQHGQTGLLDTQNVTILVSFSKSIQVNDTRDSRGNKPWKAKESIDDLEGSIDHKIIVVCFTMFQLVVLVADQVPCDTIIKVNQDEAQEGRSSSHDRNPSLSIQVTKVSNPWTDSITFSLVRTVNRPLGVARSITALVGRFKGGRNIQSFNWDLRESKFLDQSPDKSQR